MKIYLSLNGVKDKKILNQDFQQLKKNIQSKSHQIIIPEYTSKTSDRTIFKQKKALIEEADCIVAEVSKTSLDQGGEIVYSLTLDKPVLALIKANQKDNLTPMLTGNPSDNLFIDYYDNQNLRYILQKYFKHVNFLKHNKGKLIVIDGSDGSGKATQAKLILKYLKKSQTSYRFYDFPRYYSSFHGRVVGRMLAGEFGELNSLSPYLASLAYALDRASVQEEMSDFLSSGGLIVCNRYVTSSMAHWGGRFNNAKKRDQFLQWLIDLEYKVHQMPKENIVIYLYVPWQVGLKLTKNKGYREYLKGRKTDIVEKDIEYQVKSEKMFLSLCKRYKHWIRINCINNQGKMYSRSSIHQKILKQLKSRKLL